MTFDDQKAAPSTTAAQRPVSPAPPRPAGTRPQAQPPLVRAGEAGPRGTPTVRTPVVAPTPKLLVEALHAPGPGQTLIATALSQNLPDSFWTAVMTAGSQKYGRGWADAALGKLPPALRARLTLALLGGEHELTYAAFINQLAFLVYSNDPHLNDAKQVPGHAGTSAQGILTAAGYQAHPTIHGYWGFQMRIFTPVKGHPRPIGTKTIVAFRGTEGVKFLPTAYGAASQDPVFAKSNESGLDTLTDLAAYHTGYSQYEANEQQIIGPALKAYGSDLVATGHSLGGALAQIAVVKHPDRFSEVYTFQGANIKKSDVDRLAAMTQVKARYYRVTGDTVPTSGEKGIAGQVYEFNRKAGTGGVNVGAAWRRLWKNTGEKTESPDVSDGHNAPILLEVLEDLQGQGLARNALAQNLVKNGTQDPNELAGFTTTMPLLRTVPSKLDTTPGQEGLKQAVTGPLFLPQFQTTYENNVAYNLLLEQAMPHLQQLTVQRVQSATTLRRRLTALGQTLRTLPLRHTAASLKMLDVIYAGPETAMRQAIAEYRVRLKSSQALAVSPYRPQVLKEMEARFNAFLARKQRFIALDIPPKVVDENRDRLTDLGRLLDLWYAAHPTADALYLAARSSATPRAS